MADQRRSKGLPDGGGNLGIHFLSSECSKCKGLSARVLSICLVCVRPGGCRSRQSWWEERICWNTKGESVDAVWLKTLGSAFGVSEGKRMRGKCAEDTVLSPCSWTVRKKSGKMQLAPCCSMHPAFDGLSLQFTPSMHFNYCLIKWRNEYSYSCGQVPTQEYLVLRSSW